MTATRIKAGAKRAEEAKDDLAEHLHGLGAVAEQHAEADAQHQADHDAEVEWDGAVAAEEGLLRHLRLVAEDRGGLAHETPKGMPGRAEYSDRVTAGH